MSSNSTVVMWFIDLVIFYSCSWPVGSFTRQFHGKSLRTPFLRSHQTFLQEPNKILWSWQFLYQCTVIGWCSLPAAWGLLAAWDVVTMRADSGNSTRGKPPFDQSIGRKTNTETGTCGYMCFCPENSADQYYMLYMYTFFCCISMDSI